MATEPESDAVRLYAYIHIVQRPAVVDIEFPWEHRALAKRYKYSIDPSKKGLCPEAADRPNLVSFFLPGSVVRLSTSRWLHAIILHFEKEADAAAWADAVCVPVRGHPKQLYIRQYWKAEHWEELKLRLPGPDTDSEPTVILEEVPVRPRGLVRVPKDEGNATNKRKTGPDVITHADRSISVYMPPPPPGKRKEKRSGNKSRGDESPGKSGIEKAQLERGREKAEKEGQLLVFEQLVQRVSLIVSVLV